MFMKNIRKFIFPTVLILVILMGALFIFLQNGEKKISDKCLREQCIGIAGYSPIGFPNSSEEQIKQYWKDINKDSEIYGVHADLSNTSLLEMASKNLNIPISLVISDKDISDLTKIYEVIDKNPKIMYLGIGNEINNLTVEEYTNFLNEAKIKFPKIKEKYPKLRIMTVFQYESLLDKNNIDMLKDWEPIVDVLGLTVYPHLKYPFPREIPSDYFSSITKDFVITETSWPSNINSFSGKNKMFNSDEKEQEEYIQWIFSIKNNKRIQYINWLFLNDIQSTDPLFQGAGLRNSDGTVKPAFQMWINPS